MSARSRRRLRRTSRKRNPFLLTLLVLGSCLALATMGFGVWVISVAAEAPPIEELQPVDVGENSIIYAADGSRLGYIQSDTARTPVPLDKIPDELQVATVAVEDSRFYEHHGVDVEGVVRAAVSNLEAGEIKEGGSTITMQLARNLYITDPQRDLERKIREAKIATELEDAHSKGWILEEYLNTASYGTVNGRTAVGAARRDPAVALALQPAAEPSWRDGPPQRRPRPHGGPGLHQRRGGSDRQGGSPGDRSQQPVLDDPRALLLRLRPAAADREVRGQHRPPGRAQGSHDGLSGAPGGGARRDREQSLLLHRSLRRRGLDRPEHRLRAGDGLERGVPDPAVQPRRPGPPPAGLRVQDLRPDHRDPPGDRPRHDLLHLEAPRS